MNKPKIIPTTSTTVKPPTVKTSSNPSAHVITKQDDMLLNGDDDDDFDYMDVPTNISRATTRTLPEKTFIFYPKSSQPLAILDMYLPKLQIKLNIKHDHDLISFYHTFRSRLEAYNILIRDHNDINQKDGITLFNFTNSENWVHANIIMSRAIFNYLDDKKDEIMKEYNYGYKLLTYYESSHNGFGYLERLMERAHPKLRNPMTDTKERIKPQLSESESIFDFIKLYLEWLQYEAQEIPPRTYNDSVKLNYIINQLQLLGNPSLNMAINYLISKRDMIFSDPSHPLPLPIDLHLDRIGNTIWDRVHETARNDLLTINPIVINKAGNFNMRGNKNKSSSQIAHRNQYQITPYGTPKDNESNDSNYRRRMKEKYCEVCKKWGHGLPECDALSTHCLITKFLETSSNKEVETALTAYHKHQARLRRKFLSKRKLNRRIQKLEDDGVDKTVVNYAAMLCLEITEHDSSSDDDSFSDAYSK